MFNIELKNVTTKTDLMTFQPNLEVDITLTVALEVMTDKGSTDGHDAVALELGAKILEAIAKFKK